jgi:hypothetical protein
MQMTKQSTRFLVTTLAAVVTALLAFVAYERGTDKSLATPKVWETRMLAFGNGQATLRTIWRDELMSYQLRIEPYPAEALEAAKSPSSVQRHFTMEFLDADGFRLITHSIDARELRPVLRPDGTVVAIEARGDRQVARDVYQRAEKWDMRWSYD